MYIKTLFEVLVIFFIGSCFGSFVSMASYRLPKKIGILVTRSFCPKCNHTLRWIALIPIFSYIFQKGKCKYCHAKISIRYIITEIITAILFVVVYLKFGITYNSILLMLLITCLMITVITDIENYIILDSVQIFMLIIGLVYIFINHLPLCCQLISAFVYMLVGIILHYAFLLISKKEALGMGDIKFMAVSGIFLGLPSIGVYLFIAGLLGTIFGLFWTRIKKIEIFPFGPALAVSLFICLFFSEELRYFLLIN